MNDSIFDYDHFHELIREFAAELPIVLSGHHTVADLAARVERLLTMAETPFTIAVVGQMKTGKSSLLNALVGADLAVTGVDETTATVNWFKHGSKEQEGRFRVEWKDRPAEEFPLSEIHKWVGNSEQARATRCIEFYADTQFLRQANIVDTPGTRSVITEHTGALHEFLVLKQDRDSRSAGESADAIIYVLMPIARQNDADLLAAFEKTSRVPGASPYNSLAVVHKWETLECDDPHAEALRKSEQIQAALTGMVSLVLPVSAPLAWACEHFDDPFWSQVLDFATNTPGEILDDLLLREEDFTEWEEPTCALDRESRRRLRKSFQLPWPSFKMIVNVARKSRPAGGDSLRTAVKEISGMRQLRSALDRRFLARSRMIKAFSILSKAWQPCQTASARLRNHKNRVAQVLDKASQAISTLVEAGAGGPLEPVLRYVEETRRTVEQDLLQAAWTLRRLDEVVVSVKDAHDDMDADLRMLDRIDQVQNEIGEEWTRRLRALFGYNGPTESDRIAPVGRADGSGCPLENVEMALGRARAMQARSGSATRELFEHAVRRLQQIADSLESRSETEANR